MPMTFEKCLNISPDPYRSRPKPCEFCGLPVGVEKLRGLSIDKPPKSNNSSPPAWWRRLWERVRGKTPPRPKSWWDRRIYLHCHRKCMRWLRWTIKRHRRYSWFAKQTISYDFRNSWHFMSKKELETQMSGHFYWPRHNNGPWWY